MKTTTKKSIYYVIDSVVASKWSLGFFHLTISMFRRVVLVHLRLCPNYLYFTVSRGLRFMPWQATAKMIENKKFQ